MARWVHNVLQVAVSHAASAKAERTTAEENMHGKVTYIRKEMQQKAFFADSADH